MENINVTSGTQQTVVASAKSSAEKGGEVSGTPDTVTQTESAVRCQSRAENSTIRKFRLENENCKKEIESLKKQLSGLSEMENIRKENGVYLEALVGNKMSSDLKALRQIDPGIKTLSELGEDFIRLIENGIDAKIAYNAVKKASEGTQMPSLPMTGAVGNTEGSHTRFFTSKELDRLTKKDLENPKIFKKAMESLKRL